MKKERRAERAHPETVAFPPSFLCPLLLSLPFAHLSLGGPGEKGGEALLGQYGSPWVSASGVGREWGLGKTM